MHRPRPKRLKRQLDSTILHFDYDCFYASVFEHQDPALKALPLAVQQKQIVVTCNYEARRRGLHKLQLITEAKKICPDVVIVLGEDLTRFRDASKQLYAFLRSFSWNSQCERLGFDEVFMDVSDIIDYNVGILNSNSLQQSFFCLSKADPTCGFPFDATTCAGHVYPKVEQASLDTTTVDPLQLRLLLASHLAQYLREKLESELGYTSTVGISTNKLLAKLVGNVHKPNDQTTLWPPYTSNDESTSDNVTMFLDEHEIGKIPGIGFKSAQKLRAHVLQRPADIDTGLVYGGTKENVRVVDIRTYPGMSPEMLERILGGPGSPHGIGTRIWDLINGCDSTAVSQAREVPTQISIEDSYIKLDTLDQVVKELRLLATSLLKRMHADLLDDDEDGNAGHTEGTDMVGSERAKRWLAHPRTIRLSTRPRPSQSSERGRNRSFARISKSAPMPGFVFSLKDSQEVLAERLVRESLLPLFRRLHPEKSGWNLSLVNTAAANVANAAGDKGGVGRDIAKMFRRQDDVLKEWKVQDESTFEAGNRSPERYVDTREDQARLNKHGSEDQPAASQSSVTTIDGWDSEGNGDIIDDESFQCHHCGAVMPMFAMGAHQRWHSQN